MSCLIRFYRPPLRAGGQLEGEGYTAMSGLQALSNLHIERTLKANPRKTRPSYGQAGRVSQGHYPLSHRPAAILLAKALSAIPPVLRTGGLFVGDGVFRFYAGRRPFR